MFDLKKNLQKAVEGITSNASQEILKNVLAEATESVSSIVNDVSKECQFQAADTSNDTKPRKKSKMDLKSFREDKLKIKTQEEFAEFLGVSVADVARWESAPDTIPWQGIQLILEKTGVSMEELTGWEKPVLEALEPNDTWEETEFTRRTFTECIASALEKTEIPDEFKKVYLKELQDKVMEKFAKPKLAVVGRSDTGKSTLINTLLGADKMPTSWTPTTSIAVYVKHIDDKPAFIKEDAWVFTNRVREEVLWDEKRLHDEEYCKAWKIAAGGVDILRSFGTRQGNNYDKEAGAAVLFVDSPILKNCDIVDLPGFGTETASDDSITYATATKADVIIYLSQANGFMRIEDITYLKGNIAGLDVWEEKGENGLKPLSNLFVVASQAQTVNNGNREQLKTIMDAQCKNFIKTLPPEYWEYRQEKSGYKYSENGYDELRARFFAYTTDIPDLCEPFNNALKEVLEALPKIIDKKAKEFIKGYLNSGKEYITKEIVQYNDIILNCEKYKKLIISIEENELARTTDNEKRKDDIRNYLDGLKQESLSEIGEFYTKTINTDNLVNLMEEKETPLEQEGIELFVGQLQTEFQLYCENILLQKSDLLSERIKSYIDSYKESIGVQFRDAGAKMNFDGDWAYDLAFWGAATVLSSISFFMFSPLIAVIIYITGLASIGAIIDNQLRKSIARKIVKAFEKNHFREEICKGIREYWQKRETEFNEAADNLDKEWEDYVSNLRKTVNECDVQDINNKISALTYLNNFYDVLQKKVLK
ncbi:dynamin family protein [Phascolarctobacterium sp.]|uniref:dynamin family protein n=1 Tax=Phascolarctobacterium sp. TaxID=2049039 RepID=UPI00386FB3B3